MIVEICANGFESAAIAQKAGAHRIELCENLSVGGLTPSRELVEQVVSQLIIETHVLIRPRSGNFCYSEYELDQMVSNILDCKKLGCAGIVSGALTPNNTIDQQATKRLIEAASGMPFTFHRAIDVVEAPTVAIQTLQDLGVTRILSSGQQPTAIQGLPLLKDILKLTNNTIEIMPGGSINSKNAIRFKKSGFKMIHLSAIPKIQKIDATDLFSSQVQGISSFQEICDVLEVLS